jgi:hypothetical protein
MAITVKHTKTSAIPDAGDANLVQPSDWNADHTITGTIPVANGGTGASTLTGYVKGNGTADMTASATIPNTDITGLGTASTKDAGAALGVATLDAGGKVPVSELPAAVLGALSYQGTWNASTNTPTLTSSTGTKGYYYVVAVAGSTNLDGITDWLVGDWAVYNGAVWQKVDNTETVTSVNGQTGAVTLTTTNIAEGTNEYFTTVKARLSVSAGTGISYNNTTGVITNSSPSLGGTVTSVAATVPAFLSVSGSPITTSGTLALTYSGTALPVANGGTGRTVGNYSIYANEIHVGKDGNDTTGDGTLINPVLTITKALTLIAAGRNTVIVHPGSYSESPTVTSTNTTIETTELTGANTQISGTLTLSAAARISGLKITNLTITGSGNTYISNCTVDTQVIKSGTNYVEIINSELQCTSGVQITGAGTVSIVGNKCWGVTVSNASANVLIKDCFQVLTPSVTAGTLQIDGSAIFATSPASNAVTSSVGSFITLANSFVLNSAGTSVERVSLAGSYSILNLVYDKTNSTFTGTNLNAIDYFSVVNADTLVLTNDLAIAYGGTNSSATPTAGAVPYGTGTAYAFSAAGTAGQVLTSQGAGTPTWTTPTTGTVTSVTGTSPVVSSGGATPAISMPAATTSVSGYLTSTDWNTFNGKQPAGTYVNSVSATSPITSTGGVTPTIAMPAATGSVNGYLTSTDWTTFNSKGSGTVTSVGGTGTVNGLTLTGTVTSSGSLTLGGTLDLSSPPVIGGTAPNTVNGTVLNATNGIVVNSNTVSASYTIPSGSSAMSAGPMTVASGQTVTVPSGSRWVIL